MFQVVCLRNECLLSVCRLCYVTVFCNKYDMCVNKASISLIVRISFTSVLGNNLCPQVVMIKTWSC